jgi:ribosomal protein L37E
MREFLPAERCDRCGARACYAATKAGCSELLFCGHHYREHKDKLIENYWLIDGETETTSGTVTVPAYTE